MSILDSLLISAGILAGGLIGLFIIIIIAVWMERRKKNMSTKIKKGNKLWGTQPPSGAELLHDKDYPKTVKVDYIKKNLNEKKEKKDENISS